MKVSKRQLKRIIREERARLVEQSVRRPMSTMADTLEFAMDEYLRARVDEGEDDASRLRDEIVAIADDLLIQAAVDMVGGRGGTIDTSRYDGA